VAHLQNKVGDVYEIQLSDNRKAYAHFIHEDRVYGSLLSVFDLITLDDASLNMILGSPQKFPPIICDISRGIRENVMKPIDHETIRQFDYPGFVVWKEDDRNRKPAAWYLWDGRDFFRLSTVLPEKFRRLEYLRVWSAQEIVERIETGKLPADVILEKDKNGE
jgi:hypothetical protein